MKFTRTQGDKKILSDGTHTAVIINKHNGSPRNEWVFTAYKNKLTPAERKIKEKTRAIKTVDTDSIASKGGTYRSGDPLSTTSLSNIVNQTNREINGEIPTKTFDYIKRALDDQVQGQVDNFGKTTNEGRILNNLKNNLLEKADSQNPLYKQARNAYSEPARMEDALAQGRKFLREDSAITTDRIKKLPDSEKEFFRLGASRAIRDKLLSASDGRDAYKAIFGNEVIREKVEAAFPSKESFNKFSKDILKEKVIF